MSLKFYINVMGEENLMSELAYYKESSEEYSTTQLESYVDFQIEEKFKTKISYSDRYKYYFLVSEPETYKLYKLEVGKYTYENYDEGEYLE